MELWAEKYKPGNLEGVVGQKKAILETMEWLKKWKPGKALLFCGPPGIGKSLIVEIIAKGREFDLMQLNASDERNPEKIGNFMQTTKTKALFSKGKIILIDEVDGISGHERGGVGAVVKLIKESMFPVFVVANDPWAAKLRPLRPYVKMIKFHKVPAPSIAKRLREILGEEGVEAGPEVLKNLARWSQGDLRSAINDLQTISQGKTGLEAKDLEILGYRERKSSVFNVLPTIFHSKNIMASKNAIRGADKDPDEIFWWIETNLHHQFKDPEDLADAFETLSRADLFRSLVSKQQNWRFKGFMIDMLSGISLARRAEHHGFVPFQPPDRLIMLGRSKAKRALMNSLCKKLGREFHCSGRIVRRDYLPYLKILLKKNKGLAEQLGLEKEEVKAI